MGLKTIVPTDMLEELFPRTVEYFQQQDESFQVNWDKEDCPYSGEYWVLRVNVDDARVLTMELRNWHGCCAMGIVSMVYVNNNYREELNVILPEVKAMIRRYLDVPKVIFSFSREEVVYQTEIAEKMGFVEIGESFLSYKTGNEIVTYSLDLCTEEDWETAEELRDDNLNENRMYG